MFWQESESQQNLFDLTSSIYYVKFKLEFSLFFYQDEGTVQGQEGHGGWMAGEERLKNSLNHSRA